MKVAAVHPTPPCIRVAIRGQFPCWQRTSCDPEQRWDRIEALTLPETSNVIAFATGSTLDVAGPVARTIRPLVVSAQLLRSSRVSPQIDGRRGENRCTSQGRLRVNTSGSGGANGAADWVSSVARAASAETKAPVDLLGEYLTILADAALTGRRPKAGQLAAVRHLGRQAAQQGVDADEAVNLYLSAAWLLWRHIPAVVRTRDRDAVNDAAEAVLQVVNDAVRALVEGHQSARREIIRQEESARREFVDDLLRGDADVARLVQRAETFGLDLGRTHQIVLMARATPKVHDQETTQLALSMERSVVDAYGDREVFVAVKDDMVVIIVPGDYGSRSSGEQVQKLDPAIVLRGRLTSRAKSRWQVAAGRSYPGAYGVTRSYEEAREALALARRLNLDAAAIRPLDLLVYRVLGRDQPALVDLVAAILGPLAQSRGGAEPLLLTLETYFETGAATETARRLHMSVRTVTYRLTKVKALTGVDPVDPSKRFALHIAVLGARLLDWPAHDLSIGPSP